MDRSIFLNYKIYFMSNLYKILKEQNLLGYLELAEEVEDTLANRMIYNDDLVIEILKTAINFYE